MGNNRALPDRPEETVNDKSMDPSLRQDAEAIAKAIREGRFQRWLALMAGASSVLSGLEVAYEHYRGGYSRRVMLTPVILSGALAIAGVAGFRNAVAARTVLPIVSIVTGADAVLGFYFHVRGIARKPGGWRLPIVNIVMGPPIFAPLLFATSAYLGIIASQLRRSGKRDDVGFPQPTHSQHWAARLGGQHELIDEQQDLREGRFQRHLAVATVVAAGFSGFEAWYSHYKNNFRYRAQWTPVVIAPLLMIAAGGATARVRIAHTWLPAISAIAVIDGSVGFFYHVRGVLRRPGGRSLLFYNIIYGPPIFAPLLFAASGFLGLLASLLRREHE
jgi:type IV secretory pathway VirB2 component (pilin)